VTAFVDLQSEYEAIGDEALAAIQSVMERQWYVLGDEVERFQRRFAEYVGADHAVGVNSGSDALQLALKAVGVGRGDEVVLPSHTFVATANAVVQAGAEPVLVDVNLETYCLDPAAVEAAVTERTAAVIPVHLYGQSADMDAIRDLATDHDLAIVEDACQAHGATYRGEPAGTLGDVGCFSFYPTKNLGAYGDGGAIVTDDEVVASEIAELRNIGQTEKYHHEQVGYNSRLDEMQAAVLNVKLDYLDEWNERRRRGAAIYDERLDSVVTPSVRDDVEHVYHLYVVRADDREGLAEHLAAHDVGTLIHYPIPVHEQPAYRDLMDVSLPVTERITDEILSLPMHPWLSEEKAKSVAALVEGYAGGAD